MSNITSGYVRADVGSDGVASVYVKATGAADVAYYSLGELKDAGEINAVPLSENDSLGAERASALNFQAKFSMLFTGKTNIIKTLDALGYYDIDFIINGVSGNTYSTANITGAGTTSPYGGLKWILKSDADMNKFRYIDIQLDRCVQLSPTDELTLLTNTAPVYGTPTVSDKLYAIGQATQQTDMLAAGIQKVQVCVAGSGNIANEDLGEIRNAKFTAELITYLNKNLMSKGKAIKVQMDVEATQAGKTELQLLKNIMTQQLDHKVTFTDGTIFSTIGITAARLGMAPTHTLKVGIGNDPSLVRYVSTGFFKLDTAGVWDSLWT